MLKLATQLLVPRSNFVQISVKDYSACEGAPKSAFAKVKTEPPVEVFHLVKVFQADKHEQKVNLGIGAYRTDENKPFVLPVVKKCEIEVVNDAKLNHEYLPILGNPDFTKAATEMVLGKDSKALKEKRTLSVQTISGTGGIRLAAEFMCQHLQRRTVFVPNPTWENHMKIFKQAGFKHIKQYKYWNAKKRKLDMSSILRELSEAPEGAVVLMHASAHNPTGMDPSKAQWHQIAELIKQRRLFPFFDCAYQGFASGDIESDAFAIRHFVDAGLETILVQSFAKNMGLYNERVGNLVVVLNDKQQLPAVASQFTILVRINYSNPPAFGSRVVHKVLSVEQNRKEWEQTVCMMASRVKDMRKQLADKLKQLDTPGTWDHIVQQTGMFSYTGLTPKHVQKLKDDKHIYMLSSGRANICGLTTKNVDYVAKSISEVVKELGATADADSECDS